MRRSLTSEKSRQAALGGERDWYSHEEGHELGQGLLLGAGGKLRDCLDDFVHDAAQVGLQLLPAFLHKLGILGRQTDRQVSSGRLSAFLNHPENTRPTIFFTQCECKCAQALHV